ncbi:MAG: 5-formyltetrahydrofolate cyclo-ligase [Neisseria sp.]|uniref:5-formyltetrahydrofolate cyclo-ligase n=1 Tax=Neisseria sp. TaxID=192066 RepID=UPI0026DC48FE|nr:5-formyltetrahydrofolate cyclo-ligase [Neisseria sp.]MDO4641472.1 5-formyltetrahydrofolate cyclo-ligase [Neisseria sp.]
MPSVKSELRRQLRRARRNISASQRRHATLQANRQLKKFIKRGQKIAAYWPIGGELRLDALLATAQRRGAKIYLPYIEKNRLRLWFTPYQYGQQPERNTQGRMNIPQFAGRKIRADKLNLMLLPLVGADSQGYRLGQGGGFYDATLARTRPGKPLRIGVGFACQLVDTLPHEAHDIRLNAFVCENGIRRFPSSFV